jgi:hypothetical protein
LKGSFIIATAILRIATSSVQAAESNSMKQCIIGPVKLEWKVWKAKRCLVIDKEAKFKETLQELGWSEKVPQIDWTKHAAVIDLANNPYGNAVAACEGVYADQDKQKAVFRWKWVQRIASPSSTPGAKDGAIVQGGAADQTFGDQVKESAKRVPQEAVEKMKAVGEDFKKFPNPVPGRAAVIAAFPRELLTKTPAFDCRMQK